jgi:hypothetical protein
MPYQSHRAELWYRSPSAYCDIAAGQTVGIASMAAIKSYSLFLLSTKATSLGVHSGRYLMGRNCYVNSLVDGVSCCFVLASAAPSGGTTVCFELFNADMKRWR